MTRGSRRVLLGLAAILLIAGLALALLDQPTTSAGPANPAPSSSTGMRAGAFNPPRDAPDFALPGSDGSRVTLARYRGKIVLMTFGFTYCAAVCPTTLSTLAQARKALGAQADAVQVIFVTVDPDRDTIPQMRDYLAVFGPGFVGAAGTPDALAAVRAKYGVTASKQGTGTDYAMAHTSSIFLIDRAGKLRGMMPFGHDAADFVNDIQLLLRE